MAVKKYDKSINQYCARSLLPNVQTLTKSARNILKRSNIEDIHDLRVSSRRIRTVINSFTDYLPNKKVKSWQKDIRAITKSFGSVRDLDVQIKLIDKVYKSTDDTRIRSGLRRIRLRLKQKRNDKQTSTSDLTKTILESTSIIEMSAWAEAALAEEAQINYHSSDLFQLGYKQIQTCLDEFLFYEVFIFDPDRVEELHQMRISAKRLRYALEIFSDLYKKDTDFALIISRQAQEYLGNIHDSDMWIEYLPKFMDKEMKRIKDFYGYSSPYNRIRPGIEYLISNRQKERSRLYKAFLKDWKNWKLKETWLDLRKVIFLTSLEAHPEPSEVEPPKELPVDQKKFESAEPPEQTDQLA